MPLKADPNFGGTHQDGSISSRYCSYCYRDGRFVNPEMTIDDMREHIIARLGERGYPRFVARFFTLGLEKLDRWR
ncbi:hypothetical protein D779_2926 [Imhoffiella purpurea]|uniref:Putative zinc ribbon domain-containing protein n=2 Tax=Imhoffiella purpurea TaxID=1249627 RepID=W9VV30_9GAMM|nr:hypothetical protein D779_2926 [Imhoffiella purpurea]